MYAFNLLFCISTIVIFIYLCCRWIQPLGLTWNEETSVVEDGNANLFKQGISAFYDGLVENAHIKMKLPIQPAQPAQ